MTGRKTGLVAMGVGEGGVWARGRCVWASWWARSRSQVCSTSHNKVMSWSEVSLGLECSASEAELMGCSRALHHEYRGLFCGYKMVEDYNSYNLVR